MIDFVRAHPQCVVLVPFGHGKTYSLAGLSLFELGENHLDRQAIVSKSQGQAEKPLSKIRQIIESSPELQLVFPRLRRTRRSGEPWTTTAITVDRPPGIRDPSLVARGWESEQIIGSRWRRMLVDDVHNHENSSTQEARLKVRENFIKEVRSRADPRGFGIAVIGTAWHPQDLIHWLMDERPKGMGWPGLVMRADGTILFLNTKWDSPLIRPADDLPYDNPLATYRLVAHDPDPDHLVTLWPERMNAEELAEKKAELPSAWFNQIYLNICRDDATSLCKQEDIDKSLELGRTIRLPDGTTGVHSFVPRIDGVRWLEGVLTFTGVDLAFSKASGADESAIFTFAVMPDTKIRVPLWLDHGKWGTAELAKRIDDHNDRYHPAGISFESNSAQEGVRQMMVSVNKTLPLKPYVTNATKNRIEYGVPVIFTEFANGAWAIPNGPDGKINEAMSLFLDQCLYYVPTEHTGDLLMACFFGLQLAKRYGALAKVQAGPRPRIAANIMSR